VALTTTSADRSSLGYRLARLEDGPALWSLAKDNGLDENSPYAYLLWSEYFRDTTVVAAGDDDRPVGFVMAFLRPDEPDTAFVWQIGVSADHRRRGIAGALLDVLFERTEASVLEATVTPSNAASETLFRRFGDRHGLAVAVEPLFGEELFPPGHEAELRFRIGPDAR
jgi:L-2,4-diaminobutyric acid acetyltransferase